jgi:hypothetical protein
MLCIGYLLLQTTPKLSSLKQKHLSSHSFCGLGIGETFNWVFWFRVSHEVVVKMWDGSAVV